MSTQACCCESYPTFHSNHKNFPLETVAVYSNIGWCLCSYNVLTAYSVTAPLAKDEYAWSSKNATMYVNTISTGTSILSVIALIGTKVLENGKRIFRSCSSES